MAVLEFYLGCCFALPLEGSSQPPKMVKCKLNLNSSLTDSVRDELQVQCGSSHFHGPAHTVPLSAADSVWGGRLLGPLGDRTRIART